MSQFGRNMTEANIILHTSEVEHFHKRYIFILRQELVWIGNNGTLLKYIRAYQQICVY